ncbi:MAG TPA: lysyl oxidase family protein [Thermoanaerobaculia bacterium]
MSLLTEEMAMGVNLISKVRNFSIGTETFPSGSHDVQDGCVTPGSHRVLRFDFVSSNIGNADLVIGKPADRPDLFVFSAAHGHFHFKDFNEYRLFATNGDLAMPGKKQGFCLADVERNDGGDPGAPSSRQFDPSTCAYQGITAGWSDVYDASLPCQYIVLDGVADGDYTLVAITNAAHLVAEDNFDDNSVCTGLHIAGNAVTEIPPPIHVDLTNSTIQFLNVPEGETRLGAAVFDVRSCRSVTFTIVSGPAFVSGTAGSVFSTTPLGTSITIDALHDLLPRPARIWIGYKGTAQGDSAVGTVTIRCIETAQDFVVKLTANTIARPKAVVAMALDKSGSMLDDAGDGRTRIQVLHDSATPFVDRLHEKDSVGIVSFDQDPHSVLPLTTIGSLDDATDTSRTNARQAIINHTPNPAGLTAIGDGIEAAQNLLAPVLGSFDVVATVVLTDGQNTAPKSVDDVAGLVNPNQHIFAIGLGTPEEIDPSTLNKICAQHDGYLLMTGQFTDQSKFRLAKYYQQILASVKNDQIVTDPEGALQVGDTHRIPFRLNETDIAADIVLLTPAPAFISFTLETPDGGSR